MKVISLISVLLLFGCKQYTPQCEIANDSFGNKIVYNNTQCYGLDTLTRGIRDCRLYIDSVRKDSAMFFVAGECRVNPLMDSVRVLAAKDRWENDRP